MEHNTQSLIYKVSRSDGKKQAECKTDWGLKPNGPEDWQCLRIGGWGLQVGSHNVKAGFYSISLSLTQEKKRKKKKIEQSNRKCTTENQK